MVCRVIATISAPAVDVGYVVAHAFRRASELSAVRLLPAVEGPDLCRLEIGARRHPSDSTRAKWKQGCREAGKQGKRDASSRKAIRDAKDVALPPGNCRIRSGTFVSFTGGASAQAGGMPMLVASSIFKERPALARRAVIHIRLAAEPNSAPTHANSLWDGCPLWKVRKRKYGERVRRRGKANSRRHFSKSKSTASRRPLFRKDIRHLKLSISTTKSAL